MAYGDGDIWDWLRIGGSLVGAANGAGAFGGAGATGMIPPADVGGTGLAGGGVSVPDAGFGAPTGIPGALPVPDGALGQGGFGAAGDIGSPTGGPPINWPKPAPAATAPKANLGLPQTTPLTADAVNAVTSSSPPPVPQPVQSPLTAEAVNATTASSDPRSWWQRNIGEAWDKAWKEDPKTGISPAQKALAGFGQQAITANKGPEAPKFAAAGGSIYKPTPVDAAKMALAREQQLELLRRRATLNAPWLRRGEQRSAGLMG